MDSGDKATNKAMASAFKYACFQVFCIPTEEMKEQDPDVKTPEPSEKKPLPDAKTSKPSVQKKLLPDAKTPEPNVKENPASNVSKVTDSKKDSNSMKEVIQEDKILELEQVLEKNKIQPQTIYVLYRVNSLKELSEKKYQNILEHISDIKKHQNKVKIE